MKKISNEKNKNMNKDYDLDYSKAKLNRFEESIKK